MKFRQLMFDFHGLWEIAERVQAVPLAELANAGVNALFPRARRYG
jgi:hypothetical protein